MKSWHYCKWGIIIKHSIIEKCVIIVDVVICSDRRILFPIVTRPRGWINTHPSGLDASSLTRTDQVRSRRMLTLYQISPSHQGDSCTRTKSYSENPVSRNVSGMGKRFPGPYSIYHLMSDTGPVTVPVRRRRCPPTTAARHIVTRRHLL